MFVSWRWRERDSEIGIYISVVFSLHGNVQVSDDAYTITDEEFWGGMYDIRRQ